MCQYLRIAFSNLHLKLRENLGTEDQGKKVAWNHFDRFIDKQWLEALNVVNKIIYEAGEPENVIRSKFCHFNNLIFTHLNLELS